MLKRIFTIALITGAGQLFIVFILKYISQHSSLEQVKAIGQMDSLVLLIMNIIALGLQPAAMRNLATTREWKLEYNNTQSARLGLSVVIAVFALLALTDQYYLVFLIAPLLALSGDYALYGRGYPVIGSLIAFFRSAIPFLLVFIWVKTEQNGLPWIYFSGLIIAYLITDLAIALFLKVPVFPAFKLNDLVLYFKTLALGMVSLSLYFIGLGVILIASYFYSTAVIATAFVGLKFYVIYKGVLRILHQAFIKDMINESICLKIDQLSAIAGVIFFGSLLIFPKAFIGFVFGTQYIDQQLFFILLGIAGLLYSLFLSMATRSMLLKKDNIYMKVSVLAASLTILSSTVLSFFWNNSSSIAISILIGEVFWMIGLIKIAGSFDDIKKRSLFTSQNLLLLFIPFGFRYLKGDLLFYYFIGFGIFSLLLLFLHYNKFRNLPIQQNSL